MFAIADGAVVGVAPIWGDEWADAVIVEHQSSNGPFTALYGHISATVAAGDSVATAQQVGTLTPILSPEHLHFGIRPGPPASVDSVGYPATTPGAPDESGMCQPDESPMVDPTDWLSDANPPSSADQGAATASTMAPTDAPPLDSSDTESSGTDVSTEGTEPSGIVVAGGVLLVLLLATAVGVSLKGRRPGT